MGACFKSRWLLAWKGRKGYWVNIFNTIHTIVDTIQVKVRRTTFFLPENEATGKL